MKYTFRHIRYTWQLGKSLYWLFDPWNKDHNGRKRKALELSYPSRRVTKKESHTFRETAESSAVLKDLEICMGGDT